MCKCRTSTAVTVMRTRQTVVQTAIAMIVWLMSVSTVFAQPTITELNIPYAKAFGVSANGSVVVGDVHFSHSGYSFRWTRPGGEQVLHKAASARDVNDDGSVVVGTNGNLRACRWTSTGGTQDLGVLPGWTRSFATGVSGDGSVVVGASADSFGDYFRAFRWTKAGMEDLGTLPGWEYATANAMSGDGWTIIGSNLAYSAGSGTPSYRAFSWTGPSGMEDLGLLPGWTSSIANGVSGDGSVLVGWSGNITPGSWVPVGRAFRWTRAGGMQDLGAPPDWVQCQAWSVSDDGATIVGAGNMVGSPRAFLWRSSLGMVDLSLYLAALGVDVSGWVLWVAADVSSDGSTIVGYGRLNGQDHAWLVTGLGPPDVAGDVTGDGLVDVNDLLAVINAWGQCPSPPALCLPDIAPPPDGDSQVNIDDLLLVLSNWG